MRLALTILTLAFAAGAAAQGSPGSDANPLPTDRADKAGTSVGDRPPFDELDMNDDGRLSKAELAHDNEFLSRFARWDSDEDGYLTMAEYDASAIVDAE